MPPHVSSTTCSSTGGQKLYYTASGIITPTGGRPVHRLREESPLSTSAPQVHTLWNQQVQTDTTIRNNKPDIIIHDSEGTCTLTDAAIP